jgi:hypothetical protein
MRFIFEHVPGTHGLELWGKLIDVRRGASHLFLGMSLACLNSFKRQATTRFCSFLFMGSLLGREGSQNVTLVLALHNPLVSAAEIALTELRCVLRVQPSEWAREEDRSR